MATPACGGNIKFQTAQISAQILARTKGDAGIVGQMIELAVQTAAELLVPDGFDAALRKFPAI